VLVFYAFLHAEGGVIKRLVSARIRTVGPLPMPGLQLVNRPGAR
jgi:hypothetical protein